MIKNVLPKQNLKILYETLIQPHLDYGIPFWGGTHESNVNKLVVQQKKIIRTITNSKYNDHTDPLFNRLRLLKVKQLYKLNTAKFMFKASRSELPTPINNQYKLNASIHTHNTRQINNPHIRYRRTQLASKQITHAAPLIWQNTPNNIKTAKHIKLFIKLYKEYLFEN